MSTGKVKWFNNSKGWGFITLEDDSEAFVHYSDVEGDGFKALYVGDDVEFELGEGPKGPKAIKVVKVGGQDMPQEGAPAEASQEAPAEEVSTEEAPAEETPADAPEEDVSAVEAVDE